MKKLLLLSLLFPVALVAMDMDEGSVVISPEVQKLYAQLTKDVHPLLKAYYNGGIPEMEKVLAKGIDINAAVHNHKTLVDMAYDENNEKVIIWCCKKGAKVNHLLYLRLTPEMRQYIMRNGKDIHPVLKAYYNGGIPEMEKVLAKGIDINAAVHNHKTLVDMAYDENNEKVIIWCCKKGAKVNHLLYLRLTPEMRQYIMRNGKDIHPVLKAYYNGGASAVEKVLAKQPSFMQQLRGYKQRTLNDPVLGTKNMLDMALESGDWDLAVWCRAKGVKRTMPPLSLEKIVETRDLTQFKWRVEMEGEDIDAKFRFAPYTALLYAAEKGYLEMVQYAVLRGANLYRRVWQQDALSLAIRHGHTEIAHYLIEVGANIYDKDAWGDDALSKAIDNDNKEVAQALLKAGSKIDALDEHGWTRLHNACLLASSDARVARVALLLELGADPNGKNKDGGLPLGMTSNLKVAQCLVQAGADIHARQYGVRSILEWAIEKSKDKYGIYKDDAKRKQEIDAIANYLQEVDKQQKAGTFVPKLLVHKATAKPLIKSKL